MTDFSFDLSGPLADIPGNVFTLLSIIVNAVFALLFTIYRRKPADTETAAPGPNYDRCSDVARGILRQMVSWRAPSIDTQFDKVNIQLLLPGSTLDAGTIEIDTITNKVALFCNPRSNLGLSIDHLTKRDRKAIITRAKQLQAERERDFQTNLDYIVNG